MSTAKPLEANAVFLAVENRDLHMVKTSRQSLDGRESTRRPPHGAATSTTDGVYCCSSLNKSAREDIK